jgi:hypothetical protein
LKYFFWNTVPFVIFGSTKQEGPENGESYITRSFTHRSPNHIIIIIIIIIKIWVGVVVKTLRYYSEGPGIGGVTG